MSKFVVHCKRDKYDVYIGRPSKWGNPFSHLQDRAECYVQTREQAIRAYEIWIKEQPELMASLHELKGKVLGCWCAPNPCHGHVLARLANEEDRPYNRQDGTTNEISSVQNESSDGKAVHETQVDH